jgi:hypothetical protein
MKESRKTLIVLLALLFITFLPTLSTVPFPPQDTPLVMKEVLTQTSISNPWLTSAIHITPVVLLAALYWYGSRVGRVASAFFGILFIFIAFSNHIAVTQNYGLVVVTGNLVSILVVGFFGCGKYTNLATCTFSRNWLLGDTGCYPSLSWLSGFQ